MAVRYYDEALYNKINSWVKDEHMCILKPDETARLLQTRADETFDKPITLPLIAISRQSEITLERVGKNGLTHSGKRLESNDGKSMLLNAIPIDISYQIDIYTKHYAEADEYVRNFVFNLINYPHLLVTIPYNNANIDHSANIILDPTIQDNSDVPQRLFSGQFTRWTLNIKIDDAYLWGAPVVDNWKITDTDVQED